MGLVKEMGALSPGIRGSGLPGGSVDECGDPEPDSQARFTSELIRCQGSGEHSRTNHLVNDKGENIEAAQTFDVTVC